MKQFSILLLIFIICSCQNSDRDNDITTNSSSDYAIGQIIANNIFKLVHTAAISSKGITHLNLADTNSILGCDTLIVDTISSPKTINIQFNGNCNNRNGVIKASFNSKYDIPGSITSINFNNYAYKGYQILSGSIIIVYNGLIDSLPNYSLNTSSLKIENSNQELLTWNCNQKITIKEGHSTAVLNDDVYSITGIALGNTFKGNNFSTNIISDLTQLGNCDWPSNGKILITPENKAPRDFDFGSGCNNNATTTIYDITYEIVLP